MTKYRGFRKDGKGWVEGYYKKQLFYNRFDNTLLYEKHFIGTFDNLTYFDGIFEQIEIHPESLGMATTLTDKNGKEIFGSIPIDGVMSKGGDRVQKEGKTKVVIETNQEINDPHYEIGDIVFENGAFQIKWTEGVNSWFGKYPHQELLFRNCDYIEIIGNQYEPHQP